MRQQNYLFPGYPILQDDRFFKLSQDSVVLSAFARLRRGERMLDLGCGIGVLTMLMLLRSPGGRAVGLELQPGAADLARENLALCRLEDRGEIRTGDLRELPGTLCDAFEVCISNPPYFDPGRGFVSPRAELAAARSEQGASIGEVCRGAGRALRWGGRFYLCYPPQRLVALFAALTDSRLEPKTLRLVYPDEGKEPCLALVEARKGGGAGLRVMPPLFIAQNGHYNDVFKRIYQLEPLEESQNAR